MKSVNEHLNENNTERGEDLARDYIAKIRNEFKRKKFTDDEVEAFIEYMKTFVN